MFAPVLSETSSMVKKGQSLRGYQGQFQSKVTVNSHADITAHSHRQSVNVTICKWAKIN